MDADVWAYAKVLCEMAVGCEGAVVPVEMTQVYTCIYIYVCVCVCLCVCVCVCVCMYYPHSGPITVLASLQP